jgi:hypothetical protein
MMVVSPNSVLSWRDEVRGGGIDFARRFIGQKQARLIDQSQRNRHTLLLAAGQLRHMMMLSISQPNALQQFFGAGASRSTEVARECERQSHIFKRGEVRHQVARAVLPYKAHRLTAIHVHRAITQLEQVLTITQTRPAVVDQAHPRY